MKTSLSINKLKFKLLQDKTQRFNKYNILKLKSQNELIFALSKKYPLFFDIIKNNSMQYKQFLSAFFKCIINGINEPFCIKVKSGDENLEKVYNKHSSNYNYLTLVPWSKNNIIQCQNKQGVKKDIRVNKEQFMQALIVLFPKFIKTFPDILLDLNNKLNESSKPTISINHLYKYLMYCGDKLAKHIFYKNSKDKYLFKFSKKKIDNFLKIFTHEQLLQILLG